MNSKHLFSMRSKISIICLLLFFFVFNVTHPVFLENHSKIIVKLIYFIVFGLLELSQISRFLFSSLSSVPFSVFSFFVLWNTFSSTNNLFWSLTLFCFNSVTALLLTLASLKHCLIVFFFWISVSFSFTVFFSCSTLLFPCLFLQGISPMPIMGLYLLVRIQCHAKRSILFLEDNSFFLEQ